MSAPLDHIDTLVAQVFKVLSQVGEVNDIPGLHAHGGTISNPMNDGLHERSNGNHNNIETSRVFIARLRVNEAPQDRDALRHGVCLRREAFMRQCLPRRKDLDFVDPRAQGERRFFGLAPGWGHNVGCSTSASGHRCNQGNTRASGSNCTTRDPLVNGFEHLR